MSDLDDLKARVSILEERMDMEAGLAASRDRDIADLKQGQRAQTHMLQAMAITLSEHTRDITELKAGQTRLEAAQARLEAAQTRLEKGQIEMQVGQQTIVELLNVLIERGV